MHYFLIAVGSGIIGFVTAMFDLGWIDNETNKLNPVGIVVNLILVFLWVAFINIAFAA